MGKLSVIIPFVNEYPQIMFTIRNIAEELRDRTDFEIIAVNNYCDEVKAQNREEDKGGVSIYACQKGHPWLRYHRYEKKLSHWNAKRVGVENATGDYLFFVDGHCIIGRDSLYDAFTYYVEHEEEVHGTIHLPLTYKILEWHRLIYKLVNHGPVWDYSFTGYRDNSAPYEVPVMSCCGVLMSRKVYEAVGGWPTELGIYGGGEHFLNFTLAVLGYKKWIMNGAWCCHHGEKRGYHYNYDDYIRNKILATYLFGGRRVCGEFVKVAKGRPEVLQRMMHDVVVKANNHRQHIKRNQVMEIEEWGKKWVV